MSYFNAIRYEDSASLDAFGRLRTSDTGQRFDVEFTYDKQPDIMCEVTSGGTEAITHRGNQRDVSLSLNGVNNSLYATFCSHYDIPYTPGNSQECALTGVINGANLAGNAYYFLRSSISGSIVEQEVQITDASVDWNYSQIFIMDFQSLKVGRIRFGLNKSGQYVGLGEIVNDNIRASGYWQLPSLPVAWRMYQDTNYTYTEMAYGDENNAIGFRFRTAKNSTQFMTAICSTVKSEGGLDIYDLPGYPRSIFTPTAKTVSNTVIPLLSIRPKSLFNTYRNHGVYVPTGFSVQTDNPIRIDIYNVKPTLTGASWANTDANFSGIEYDVSATAISGGVLIFSGLYSGSNQVRGTSRESILGKTVIALGRETASDILTICAVRTTNSNASVLATIDWKEIR